VYDRLEVGGERFNTPYVTMYNHRRDRVLDALQVYCPGSAEVLDLAAASGNFSIAASNMGYDVTWNDLRGELETYVRKKAPSYSSIKYVTNNIFELDDEYHGKFDCVLALEVIEHVAHPDEFLVKLGELVKPGGVIIVSTPNGAYFRNNLPKFSDFPDPSIFEQCQFGPNSDDHIFLLYEDELRQFGEDANVRLIHYEQFTNPLSVGHVKLHYLHKLLPVVVIETLEKLTGWLPSWVRSKVMHSSMAVYRKSSETEHN